MTVSTSTSSPSSTSATDAAAPSTLAGWGILQRAVNVTMPARLLAAGKLIDAAARVLGGQAG